MIKLAVITCLAATAAFGANKSTVATGYPDWIVPGGKAHSFGREITPSDLRHKVTIVALFDAKKAKEHLPKMAFLVKYFAAHFNGISLVDVSDQELPRNTTVVFSNIGDKKDAEIVETVKDSAFTKKYYRMGIAPTGIPYYDGVTFPGAPVPEGGLPYIYIMGPEGTDPIYKGNPDPAAIDAVVRKALKEMPKWRPYYGFLEETKTYGKQLADALGKGKPLDGVSAAARRGCLSSDPEVAKESQIIYDAIEQARSDLMHRIVMESSVSPHCTISDITTLTKFWPKTKKTVDPIRQKILSNPAIAQLAGIYVKFHEWENPDFRCKNAAETKRILAELAKMKRQIAPHKESKLISVQDVALLLDAKIDELISVVPTKVDAP